MLKKVPVCWAREQEQQHFILLLGLEPAGKTSALLYLDARELFSAYALYLGVLFVAYDMTGAPMMRNH